LTWRQAQILWRGARLIALTAEEEFALDAVKAQAQLTKILGGQRVDRLESHPILSLTDKLRPASAVLAAFNRALERGTGIRITYVDLHEADRVIEGRPVGITPVGEMRILTLSTPVGLVHLRAERVRKLTLRA